MSSEYISVQLPVTEHGLNVIVVALFIAVLTGVIWLALSHSDNERPDPARRALEAFGWVYMPIWLMIFAATLWALWQVFSGIESPIAQDGFRSLGLGTLIAALLGAPFVIWGTVLKHQTVMFQKEGHMTDRINKAVEQLGAEKTVKFEVRYIEYKRQSTGDTLFETRIKKGEKGPLPRDITERDVSRWETVEETAPNIEVRIGAILSLERVAQDSTRHDKGRDHVRVMEILCAYIRENAAANSLEPTPTPFDPKHPRIDIQTALNVIKRRSAAQILIEDIARYRLDLRRTDLDGCDLSGGNFRGAIFWRSRLEVANFMKSDLTGAQFLGCLLNFSDFLEAKLVGTILNHATISHANFGSFARAKIVGVMMEDADMTGWRFRDKAESDETFGSTDTKLADRYKKTLEKGLEAAVELSLLEHDDKPDPEKISALKERQFSHWNPYTGNDGAAMPIRRAYLDSKGHIGWPFFD